MDWKLKNSENDGFFYHFLTILHFGAFWAKNYEKKSLKSLFLFTKSTSGNYVCGQFLGIGWWTNNSRQITTTKKLFFLSCYCSIPIPDWAKDQILSVLCSPSVCFSYHVGLKEEGSSLVATMELRKYYYKSTFISIILVNSWFVTCYDGIETWVIR